MEENHNFTETQLSWYAPWQWPRGFWLAAFIIWPPFYVISILMVDHWTGDEPGWKRTVVNIYRAPLEPLRKPFRRRATGINPLFIPSNCEVCGEIAVFRFWDLAVVNGTPVGRVRSFCNQHNREYLEAPADALKPDYHSSVESFLQRPFR